MYIDVYLEPVYLVIVQPYSSHKAKAENVHRGKCPLSLVLIHYDFKVFLDGASNQAAFTEDFNPLRHLVEINRTIGRNKYNYCSHLT